MTDKPLDWQAFGVWLSLLLHRHGPDVFRVKGVLAGPVVPGTRLVFLVRGIDPELLRCSFHAFLAIK